MRVTPLLSKAVKDTVSEEHSLLTGESLLSYGGVFAGNIITMEILEQGEWEPIINGVFDSTGQSIIKLAQGVKIRAVVSDLPGTPEVNLSIIPRF